MAKKFLVMLLLAGYFFAAALSSPVFAQAPQEVIIVNPSPTAPIWNVKEAVDKGITKTGWVADEEVTVVGKRAERARQFINWVLDNPSIDNHPVFRQVWLLSAGTTLFLIVIVVAVMGLAVLIARRKDVSFNVDIVPIVYKTLLLILYVAFSYLIVLAIIQLSDVMMDFFIKTLGADQLFKIFFVPGANSEEGYRNFTGYKRIGMHYAESERTSLFLIDFTSFTYFAMGIMLVLRKILLWFLLIVSPFLAILMPFIFIRNTGWIWIGVFFQWVFYGPLFALFLGALARIWTSGIPFLFDFQRAKDACEPSVFNPDNACAPADAAKAIVYPLAINILYGGPSQRPGGLGHELVGEATGGFVNSSNYVDTFAEYVISLVMLWAVIVFPWWLLRIFRDYCCDGIYAMRNILLNMMNNGGLGPQPSAPVPGPTQTRTTGLQQDTAQKIAREVASRIEDKVTTRLSEFENIKQVQTEKIAEKLEVRVSNVREVAQMETRQDRREYFHRLSEHMKNPMSAERPADRATFTNLKAEMSQRAVSGDKLASRILEATTANRTEVQQRIQTLAQSRPAVTPLIVTLTNTVMRERTDIERVMQTWTQLLVKNTQQLTSIAQSVKTTEQSVRDVVISLPTLIATNTQKEIIEKLSEKSQTSKEVVRDIIREAVHKSKESSALTQIATESHSDVNSVTKTIETIDKALGTVAKAPALAKEVVEKVVTSIEKLAATTPAVQLSEKVAQATNVPAVTVQAVIQQVADGTVVVTPAQKQVMEAVKKAAPPTPKQEVKKEEIEVDELINEKDTLSLDEYEEIKQLWMNHYLHGEVPISETIKTREDWVNHDSVTIENILNKIISDNEEVRTEGLKEVADSIPFFVLADMSISDIAVYLKAKRAAAKEVLSIITRESAVKQRLQATMQEAEVFVDTKPAATVGKTQTQAMELDINNPEEKKEEPEKGDSGAPSGSGTGGSDTTQSP
ncbi:MAG: hypothetical protein NUV52_01985 [Candidatus Roizmanbacteria bacterium]|nr:hypothetical protein [Candidatus Roizmanbacteria bacterium]